jgi:hypothetical protein
MYNTCRSTESRPKKKVKRIGVDVLLQLQQEGRIVRLMLLSTARKFTYSYMPLNEHNLVVPVKSLISEQDINT